MLRKSKARCADKILLNKVLAIPLFMLIMGFIFYATFSLSDVYLKERLAVVIFNATQALSDYLASHHINPSLHALIIDGICAGIGSVLAFIPTIGTLFFFLSLLEESGYMHRVAYIMDGPMGFLGLPGEAIVPMISGFGCSVPAIMAVSRLPSEKAKKLTVAIIPFMSCSAKLPIYVIFSESFFPRHETAVVACIYFSGIFMAMLYALLLKHVFYGKNTALKRKAVDVKAAAKEKTAGGKLYLKQKKSGREPSLKQKDVDWKPYLKQKNTFGQTDLNKKAVGNKKLYHNKKIHCKNTFKHRETAACESMYQNKKTAACESMSRRKKSAICERACRQRHLLSSPCVQKLPPCKIPSLLPVLSCAWTNVKGFIKKAFTVILLASVIVWMLQNFDFDMNRAASSESSMLADMGKFLLPLFAPLGFSDWRAVSAVIAGISAKESVIGTLSILSDDFSSSGAASSIAEFSGGNLSCTLTEIFSPLSAVSFMLFSLLYMPCITSLAAVKNVLGSWRYSLYMLAFQTGLAWAAAFLVFNAGRLLGF